MDITELLAFGVKNKASDLHLSAGLPPMIRVHGDMRRINLPPMEHKEVHAMIYDIMNDQQRKFYEENKEVDFSFEVPGLARFRVNAFIQNRGAAAVMRTIPSKILSLADLKALDPIAVGDGWQVRLGWTDAGTGPDADVTLHTFRVDSPTKGSVSGIDAADGIGDESKLSFMLVTIDTEARKLTAREVLWNGTRAAGAPLAFGTQRTVSIVPPP